MASNNFVILRASRINGKWYVGDKDGRLTTGKDHSNAKWEDMVSNFKRLTDVYGKVGKKYSDFMFKLWPETGRVRHTTDFSLHDWSVPKLDSPKKVILNTKAAKQEAEALNLIHTAMTFKPNSLIISEVKWKYLVRSVLRGKNLMMTGPAGCGKTLAVTTVAAAMNRPFFYFNLGATQDPRSALIGNTHFNKDTGTYFADSTFVKAIQTENSVILLDELSRAHPEAWNILMTVLDETQRYLRVDESPESPVITVANGVSFLATANVGMEYTSTRTIDRAINDRFQILEMDLLSKDQQKDLINLTFPNLDVNIVEILADIYNGIHAEVMSGSGKISTSISTRTLLSAAGLLMDGFTVLEAAEVSVFPYFSNDGGTDSERTYVRQLVQKFIPDAKLKNTNIFSAADA